MMSWTTRQLTRGSDAGQFHSHSYYDIPIFSADSHLVILYRTDVAGRHPTPEDRIEIGMIDITNPALTWAPLGESRAWSVQQGPMAQWVPPVEGAAYRAIWNDREDGRFVARITEPRSGVVRTLPRPVYAVSPSGRDALSVDLARLDTLRPGYGYPGGVRGTLTRRPSDDGVWRMDIETGEATLVLSLKRAAEFMTRRIGLRGRLGHLRRRYTYWFNHVKISPDGKRFTVKLRFRVPGGPWNDTMGASLTCGIDGSDLRLLATATSHVIWMDNARLYFWQRGAVRLFSDAGPGCEEDVIAPDILNANVHIREMPGAPGWFVYDTPYREDIDVMMLDQATSRAHAIARFTGHVPARGPFRCDLHPCPSPDGRHVIVTTLQDGGRQVHLLSKGVSTTEPCTAGKVSTVAGSA